jgi:hypothetical protein
MVGYRLLETITPHGPLARAVCRTDQSGWLQSIEEVTGIRLAGERAVAPGRALKGSEVVSMNFWGFKLSIFDHLESGFREFLSSASPGQGGEFYLPAAVQRAMDRAGHRVRVFPPAGMWMGMTDRMDHEAVVKQIADLVGKGIYPRSLPG